MSRSISLWIARIVGLSILALAAVVLIEPSPVRAIEDASNCMACHGTRDLNKTDRNGNVTGLFVNPKNLGSSVHKFLDCSSCHTLWPHSNPSALDKASLAEACAKCHADEYKQHVSSIHGQAMMQGSKDVATCVDCHSITSNPHDIQPILSYESTVYRRNVAATCAKCHADPSVMSRYGIDAATAKTYQESYHGKAMSLGSYEIEQCNKATCSDCHGTHNIVAMANPKSPVNIANLGATCAQCHPGAGDNFAKGWMGHTKPSTTNFPVVYWSNVFYVTLIVGTISFGAMHVGLDFVRTRQLHRRKHELDDTDLVD